MSISEMEPDYAGFWRRMLASSLDNLVWILFYVWIYVWIVGGAFLAGDTAGIVALIAFFSFWFNYFAFCEWRWGQTIGKNATGIEVRSCEGARRRDPSDDGTGRIDFGQASVRNLLRLIDLFAIGELMILTTKRRQRLGDKAAKTVVLRRAPRTATAEPVAPPQSGSRSGASSHEPPHSD